MDSNFSKEPIVVFGFGAQGSAQAMNLRDSGLCVSVCLRPESKHLAHALDQGFNVITDMGKASREAKTAVILIPDIEHAALYRNFLESNLPKNAALVFAHGFSIHYKKIIPRPDLDVILVAPLAHAEAVRENFLNGNGVPFVIAVAQDATSKAHERAIAYANSVSRGGPFIESTFEEEVVSDLFVEQALLCGGLPELVRASFDALVAKGINPDIAYFSCLKELRPIVNIMDKHGIAGMRERISSVARYGAITRGKRVIDHEVRKNLDTIFGEILSGEFAKELEWSKNIRDDGEHLIEKMHKKWDAS